MGMLLMSTILEYKLQYPEIKNIETEESIKMFGKKVSQSFFDEFCFHEKIFSKVDFNINLIKAVLNNFDRNIFVKENTIFLEKSEFYEFTEIAGIWFLKGFLSDFCKELFHEKISIFYTENSLY